MTTDLINDILERISDELPEFKAVDLFNNQVEKINEGEDYEKNLPMLFISFPEAFEWRSTGQRVQRADQSICRLVIVQRNAAGKLKNVKKIFELKEKVFQAFQGFQGSSQVCSGWSRSSETTDEDHRNLYVFEQEYSFMLLDDSANIYRNRTATDVSNLNVETSITDGKPPVPFKGQVTEDNNFYVLLEDGTKLLELEG